MVKEASVSEALIRPGKNRYGSLVVMVVKDSPHDPTDGGTVWKEAGSINVENDHITLAKGLQWRVDSLIEKESCLATSQHEKIICLN